MATSFFHDTLVALLIVDDPASTLNVSEDMEKSNNCKLQPSDTRSQPETETSSQMEGDGTIDSHPLVDSQPQHQPPNQDNAQATDKIVIPPLAASLAVEADTSDSATVSTLGIDDGNDHDDDDSASHESSGPYHHPITDHLLRIRSYSGYSPEHYDDNNGNDYDDEEDDSDVELETSDDYQGLDALDLIDESWKGFRKTGDLSFSGICFDARAIMYLFEQYDLLQQSEQEAIDAMDSLDPLEFGTPNFLTKSVKRIEMNACNFWDVRACQYWIRVLQLIPTLEELFISGVSDAASTGADRAASSLLQGLCNVTNIQRLALDRADLRGAAVGHVLLLHLLNSPNLKELRLNYCRVDEQMLPLFCQGLQHRSSGLIRLDLDGWQLIPEHLTLIVKALLHSKTKDTLEAIDISNNRLMDFRAFPSLAVLLSQFPKLREVYVCNCPNLFATDVSETREFQVFCQALEANTATEEIWLGNKTLIWQPMAAKMLLALGGNKTLAILNAAGMKFWKKKKNGKQKEKVVPFYL